MRPCAFRLNITHRMKPVSPIVTGEYLESPSRVNAPKELVATMGMQASVLSQPILETEAIASS